jgi:hypothetical protein
MENLLCFGIISSDFIAHIAHGHTLTMLQANVLTNMEIVGHE